jgi:hypothetical protein
VASLLESRNHRLPQAPVTPDQPENLRVFVQCMEMKKEGPLALTQRNCKALLARSPGQDPVSAANPTSVY